MGLSEKEFNEIVDRTVIPPHEPNYQSNEIAPKTWDFDEWYRENNKKNRENNKKEMIGIINYGLGNLSSVKNAFKKVSTRCGGF